MKQEGVAGILVSVHAENTIQRKLVVELATASLPTLYPYRFYVELGGLMSYGSSVAEFYCTAAGQIDQILKGGKPGDMPIQQSLREVAHHYHVGHSTIVRALGRTEGSFSVRP